MERLTPAELRRAWGWVPGRMRYRQEKETDMTTALIPAPPDMQTMLTMAQQLHGSGLLGSHIKSPAAAFAIIQKGIELGVPPMQALATIDYIEGKPTANAQLIAALIYHRHGDAALVPVESTAERATFRYKRRGWSEYLTYTYTMDMARKAGLATKTNWQRNPDPMLRARCISAIGRMAFQDVIGGLYTDDEGEEIAETARQPTLTVTTLPPEPAAANGGTVGAVLPPIAAAELSGKAVALPERAADAVAVALGKWAVGLGFTKQELNDAVRFRFNKGFMKLSSEELVDMERTIALAEEVLTAQTDLTIRDLRSMARDLFGLEFLALLPASRDELKVMLVNGDLTLVEGTAGQLVWKVTDALGDVADEPEAAEVGA